MKNLLKEFFKGIIKENPTFVLALGLCPTLAVSVSVSNGIGMGIAATFVIIFSNIIIAFIKGFIPDKIRIPCYIVVIATFVTITELAMKAYFR
jgi:electron transport complex protein RnfE